MLDASYINHQATNGKSPAGKTVTGEYIAKASRHYSSRQRAVDAARWIRGQLQIKPTLKLAAKTFGVSIPLVAAARERLEQQDKHRANGNGTTTLSDSAVENIVAEVGVDRVWRAIEKLTQPQLPLVAAE